MLYVTYYIDISADICCTLPITLLSLLTYAVRYHYIVISADVRCTLPLHCYLAAAAGTVKSCR